jgi:hypothetical protein
MRAKITIEWFGVATFRLRIDDLVVFLDGYMDRVPSAPPVGLSSEDVDRADFILVGHSHFDHLHGAQHIAKNTGAKIIGSNETARVMRERGVPKDQLVRVQGGDRHRLADGVTVRVFPSLHACTWVAGSIDIDEEFTGHVGLCEDERATVGGLVEDIRHAIGAGDEQALALRDHLAAAAGSFDAGGALVYLIETPAGAIFTRTPPAAGRASCAISVPAWRSWRRRVAATWTASRTRARWRSSWRARRRGSSRGR